VEEAQGRPVEREKITGADSELKALQRERRKEGAKSWIALWRKV